LPPVEMIKTSAAVVRRSAKPEFVRKPFACSHVNCLMC
jgi:hypothetical protein